jgi:hypothetical protein
MRIQLAARQSFNDINVLAALGCAPAQSAPASYRTYFPTPRSLMHEAPALQAVAGDVDNDGDEDKLAVQPLPLTDAAGKSVAAGGTVEITLEPPRLCRLTSLEFSQTIADGFGLYGLEVGTENLLPAKGLIPCSKWAPGATTKSFDAPWCGPGVPVVLSFKNISAGTLVFYGSANTIAVIG